MTSIRRNDLSIYDRVADRWWADEGRWVRTLKNLVPVRLAWFDRYIDWTDKAVLDLGCAGGFMAEALASKGRERQELIPLWTPSKPPKAGQPLLVRRSGTTLALVRRFAIRMRLLMPLFA